MSHIYVQIAVNKLYRCDICMTFILKMTYFITVFLPSHLSVPLEVSIPVLKHFEKKVNETLNFLHGKQSLY